MPADRDQYAAAKCGVGASQASGTRARLEVGNDRKGPRRHCQVGAAAPHLPYATYMSAGVETRQVHAPLRL